MSGNQAVQGKVRYVKKVKLRNILLIGAILAAVLVFGRLTNFFGKYTGEVADDERTFNKRAVQWSGQSVTAVLSREDTPVYLPAPQTLRFDSEQTRQRLILGNPEENELPMNFTLHVQDREIYSSGILSPGKGVDTVETNAYFEPNTYEATIVYTFYHQKGARLKVLDTLEQTVTLEAVGSGEKYQSGVAQNAD